MKLTEKILSFHAEENLVSEFGLEAIIVKSWIIPYEKFTFPSVLSFLQYPEYQA